MLSMVKRKVFFIPLFLPDFGRYGTMLISGQEESIKNVLSVKNFFVLNCVYQGVLRDQSCACPCWSPPQRGSEYSSYLTWTSCFESLNIFVYLSKSTSIDDELQPECNDEVDELPANPGPVSQRGVVVHPLPRDRDEGGVHVLVANLHFKCRIFTFFSDNPPFEWSPVWQQWCCSSSPSRPACQAVGRSAVTKINF